MARKIVLVCTQCQTANRNDARKCNSCGRELFGLGGMIKTRFERKWVCPDCGEMNHLRNPTCINDCNEEAPSPVSELLQGKAFDIKQKMKEKRNEVIIQGIEWMFKKMTGGKK
jgi:predicted RNA-binding Zn-ribbon protein involved in translation (DUF1610 family)